MRLVPDFNPFTHVQYHDDRLVESTDQLVHFRIGHLGHKSILDHTNTILTRDLLHYRLTIHKVLFVVSFLNSFIIGPPMITVLK